MLDSPSTDENLKIEQDQQQPEDSSPSELDTENNAEDSSDSETSEKELSTFDLVKSAIDPDSENEDETEEKSEEDESEASEDESKDENEDEEDISDEPSEDELKTWKGKTRKRFEKLQAKYRDVNERLEKAEVDAGYYRQFSNYLEENRISQDEANELFQIGAMLKNDPVKALELMTPHYQNLLHLTGNVLPADLKQQVDQGYITKQHATELSRLRANGQTTQAIEQEKRQYQQQQAARQQQQQYASMQSALTDWETNWSTSDPDYNVKRDRVLERVELSLARASRDGTLPQTVEQAVQLADKAKKEVEAELKQLRPRKPVDTVSGGSSNSSLPEPKDTQDVIRRALGS